VAELDHFTYGWINPVLAYAASFLGSLLGLTCTARARRTQDQRSRAKWLALAAVAIGGTGIWLMHFMAMLGFTVPASGLRYDMATTIASAVAAIGVVGVGLFVVGYRAPSALKLLLGGLLTGLGVATMHYTGMAAMRVRGAIGYDGALVTASVLIAVVAATVALWFTLVAGGRRVIALAAMVMGVAVCGMHYTGMAAMRVHLHEGAGPLGGADPVGFLVPTVLFVSAALVVMLYAVLGVSDDDVNVTAPRLRA
jgi:NO-binding membrane sensor protein with MHYT domain